VLVANRGEIAGRVLAACRRLGIQTVAVYSEADRDGPWLRLADRAICIGPGRADASYLDADAVLQAAEQAECQAVHPGYGFLAENPIFAARCAQHGLTFIGPPPAAIRRMGDKVAARQTMAAAGLPTIPGSEASLRDSAEALLVAERIGYPVLLKAAAGGGGRGMRRCCDPGELERSFAVAALESEKAFGSGELYLEKYVAGGRHVEFQVLCDAYGKAVHLGERECSIQRSHQKLLEESPSPALDESRRAEFGAHVTRAVAGFGYRNAGTVEFLLAPTGELYFMEMNTRLQVEHPVTEMVTGEDLVVHQLRIAAMQPLSLTQDAVTMSGHAIELRINAEDPEQGFRPAPGTIRSFRPPPTTIGEARVRWDSVIEEGYRLPAHYDSLIGKLIVHGGDRRTAIRGAQRALELLQIEGVPTTRQLHLRLLEDPQFVAGQYDVGFLERRPLVSGLAPS
jgi:acetyl-CoA carboxylase biotin carboxylase subunit